MKYLSSVRFLQLKIMPVTVLSLMVIFFSGCVTGVTISRDDKDPPSATVSAIGEGKTIAINSAESESKTFCVVRGENLSFWSGGFDQEGIKSYKITVLDGGLIKHESEGEEQLTDQIIIEGPDDGTKGVDRIIAGGSYKLNDGSTVMTVQAEAEDFAGNSVKTPVLTIKQVEEVEVSLRASKARIEPEEQITLFWGIDNADFATLSGTNFRGEQFGGSIAPNDGSRELGAASTSWVYTLEAGNCASVKRAEVEVKIIPSPEAPEIIKFEPRVPSVAKGQSTELIYEVEKANRLTIEPIGFETRTSFSGTRRVSPERSQNYTLSAFGLGGTTEEITRIIVGTSVPQPPMFRTGCCSDGAPPGYIRTDDFNDLFSCGNPPSVNTLNVCEYIRYDNRPIGSRLTVCSSEPIPRGWVEVRSFTDNNKCGAGPGIIPTPENNVREIERVE